MGQRKKWQKPVIMIYDKMCNVCRWTLLSHHTAQVTAVQVRRSHEPPPPPGQHSLRAAATGTAEVAGEMEPDRTASSAECRPSKAAMTHADSSLGLKVIGYSLFT